jgi:hypothetical protein
VEVQSADMHPKLPPPPPLPQFSKMDTRDRMALVERLKLCVACLTSGHNRSARLCPNKEERADACKKPACKASHHHLLHIEGGQEQQGREGLWANLVSGTREGTRPETTVTLRMSQQVKGADWRCRVPKCRTASHKLRECKELSELLLAARLDLVREYDLCKLCLGLCKGKIKGKKCRLRNVIHNELCQEQNKCRRRHHWLLHVDEEDWRNLQEAKPAKPAEPPSGPTESLACNDSWTAVAGAMLAQMVGERGEAEQCELPLPWKKDYEDILPVEEDIQLNREFEQLLRDSDLDDDPSDDRRSPQLFYRSWEHGYGVNSSGRAATPVAICAGVRHLRPG